MDADIELHVVLIRESGQWVAQCLQYDIAAQGATIPEAQATLVHLVEMQLALDCQQQRKPFEGVPQAPQRYWDWFREGVALREEHVPVRSPDACIPPAWMIHAQVRELRVWS